MEKPTTEARRHGEERKPKPVAADYAERRRWGTKALPRMNTDDTVGNREIGSSGDRKSRRLAADKCRSKQAPGSGGLAAQFRKQPGGMDKVLDAQ